MATSLGSRMRAGLACLAVATLTGPLTGRAHAQSRYPDRPIKLIVPFPPGGVYDAIARPLADRLKGPLGTVVIENVGGAGGARGATMTARATPDGYTLLVAGSSLLVVIPLAARRPPFDPVQDFDTIARVAVVGLSIVAHPGIPVRDLNSLIEHAKANPGKLSYGTPGPGTTNHLTGELFKSLAQVPAIAHVPYTGAGPALNDLVGGHIPLAVVNVTGQVLELRTAGQIRMMAMTTSKRMPQAADVPTAIESGMPGLVAESFFGIVAPKGTPRPAIETVSKAIRTALTEPELRSIYEKASFQIESDPSPDAFRSSLAADLVRWKPIIDASGFKID